MSAEQTSGSWGVRITIGVITLVFIAGIVYYYVNFFRPQKEIDLLRKAVETASDPKEKAGAIRWLVERKDLDSAPVLIRALDDDDPTVRRAAASGLGMLGAKKAAEPLIGLLTDKEPRIRRAAISALRLIKVESAVAPLTKMLKDKDKEVQREAILALQQIGGAAAIDALKKYIKKQKDLGLKNAAVDALAILETGEAPQ